MNKKRTDAIFLILLFGVLLVGFLLNRFEEVAKAVLSAGGILVLIGIGVIAVLMFVVIPRSSRKNRKFLKEHPNFFEEVHSLIKDTLLLLEFEEKKGQGRAVSYTYSRGKFSVELTWDVLDSHLYLSANSKSDLDPVSRDFMIEAPLTQGDKFRGDSIAKLNEWLTEKKIISP